MVPIQQEYQVQSIIQVNFYLAFYSFNFKNRVINFYQTQINYGLYTFTFQHKYSFRVSISSCRLCWNFLCLIIQSRVQIFGNINPKKLLSSLVSNLVLKLMKKIVLVVRRSAIAGGSKKFLDLSQMQHKNICTQSEI